jgi:hypothetical protein
VLGQEDYRVCPDAVIGPLFEQQWNPGDSAVAAGPDACLGFDRSGQQALVISVNELHVEV